MQIPQANRQHYEAAGILESQLAELCRAPLEYLACAWCGSPPGSLVRIMDSIFGGPFHLVECRRCGLRFVWPRPAENAVEDWMVTNAASPVVAAPTDWARRWYWWLTQLIASHPGFPPVDDYLDTDDKPCVLDVGCGRGDFLEVVSSRGWHGYGCERNPAWAPDGPYPYGLFLRTFADFPVDAPPVPFHAVIMLDYLEHSQSPFHDLAKAGRLLRSRGQLCVKTFLDELDHEHKMLAPPVHLYHFTEDVLLRMIQDAGFAKPIVVHDGPSGVMVTVIAEKIS